MKFNKVYIEITNRCNLQCSFCSPTKRELKELSLTQFEEILQKLIPYTKILYLHVKGEPLAHTQFEQFLKLCENYPFSIHITTNATLLKKYVHSIQKSRVVKKLHISIHCEHTNSNYYKDVFESVELLSNKVVVYRLWTLQNNCFDKTSLFILDEIKKHYSIDDVGMDAIMKMQNTRIKENVYLDKSSQFIWPALTSEIVSETHFCFALKTHIAILSNGDIVPCCLDGDGIITLGNIFNDDLDAIILSDPFQTLKKGFQERKVSHPLCQRCGFHLKNK